MAKRNRTNSRTTKSRNAGLKFLCGFLALLMLAACTGCAWGWFKVDKLQKQLAAADDSRDENKKEGYDLGVGGLLYVTDYNGISLQAEVIELEEYAAYSISDETENAYLITATVEPEDAFDSRLS